MTKKPYTVRVPSTHVIAIEGARYAGSHVLHFDLTEDLEFSMRALETYAFSRWSSVAYDAMILAATIEFADKMIKRPALGWARSFDLRIPCHDPIKWNDESILAPLRDALEFVTGDYWSFEFVARSTAFDAQPTDVMSLTSETDAVLAFSEGLDSRAVAGLLARELGNRLVRVRVGSKTKDRPRKKKGREPFTSIPYSIRFGGRNVETSARTRGFKFALVTAIAAFLTGAKQIVMPESGQGAIAPAILVVGHGYPDYRNHPLFTRRMEKFVNTLFETNIEYVFPRIWHTKGETLRAYIEAASDNSWAETRSCWRGSQWSSVGGKLRQCGCCAACMLRRLSVHAAGLVEKDDTYVCSDLSARTIHAAVDPSFTKMNAAFQHYAVAGALHLDHFADLARPEHIPTVRRHALLLANALRIPADEAESKLVELIQRHSKEWETFVASVGDESFVRDWTRAA